MPGGLSLWNKATRDIEDSLLCISDILNIQIANPLLLTVLRLYKAKRLKDSQVRELFSLVERYHFMYTTISAQPSSGGVGLMYAAHAREIANAADSNAMGICIMDFKKKIVSKVPSRDTFVSKFKQLSYQNQRQREVIRYTLWKIYKKINSAVDVDRSTASIEHLMSQSGGSAAVHNIGNLLVVPVKFNGEVLGDKPFAQKKSLLIKHGYALEPEIVAAMAWTDVDIEQRTTRLAEYAYDTVWAIK
ncbi:HNH endonuclease family protein [Diaphorobacter sp.]|uniref:HNH endonuclease family protein n=1 Tax=Diaphorobacter sp. TaxID=1934310 RepID=UPI003D13D211